MGRVLFNGKTFLPSGDLKRLEIKETRDLGERFLNAVSREERIKLIEDFEELVISEVICWGQRPEVKWVKEEDCRTSYFHRITSGKYYSL